MLNEADLSPERASVLVAASAVADAELVERLLREEFSNVHLSVQAEAAVADFETHRPAVLVLAFDTLEAAQRYYLGLYRLGTAVHTVPHRTVVLCNSRDLWTVYELCRKEHFDDYVLFWPATNDAPRIRMAVRQALKLIGIKTRAGESSLRAAPHAPAPAASPHAAAPGAAAYTRASSAGPYAPAPEAALYPPAQAGMPATSAAAMLGAMPGATSPTPRQDAATPSRPVPGTDSNPLFGDQPPAQAHPAGTPAPVWADPLAPVRRDRPTVLMVEDDEFQQKLLARLLTGQKIELLIAGTGAEAQEKMWEYKPDLVLMDVGLPDTNGVEATRKIKAIAQFAHIPIVMVTGHSERHVVVESLKAGAADFLVKPFDRNTLIDKLRQYLPAMAAS